MQLVYLKDKEDLNNFLVKKKRSQFLQSWEWGEFQEKAGNQVIRLGAEDNGKLVSVATLIKKTLPAGRSYFYCPRGPMGQITENLFNEIKKLAKEEGVIFLRFEPQNKVQGTRYKVQKTIDVQPSKTIILDLSKPEDELLKAMHQKTRYNIRLAERKGVIVREAGNQDKEFEKFWELMESTRERDQFRLHSKKYYKKMLMFNSDFIKLFFAEYEDKVITANIISFYGDTVTYMHGASSNKYRNVMAPFLLQWHAIKLAKEKGYKYYDFFGIDEDKFPGVTRFKRGFRGQEINFLGTYDLAYNKGWYSAYKTIRKIRRNI